jgi:hypothetical protein
LAVDHRERQPPRHAKEDPLLEDFAQLVATSLEGGVIGVDALETRISA